MVTRFLQHAKHVLKRSMRASSTRIVAWTKPQPQPCRGYQRHPQRSQHALTGDRCGIDLPCRCPMRTPSRSSIPIQVPSPTGTANAGRVHASCHQEGGDAWWPSSCVPESSLIKLK
jgi:hypothetical protein